MMCRVTNHPLLVNVCISTNKKDNLNIKKLTGYAMKDRARDADASRALDPRDGHPVRLSGPFVLLW